MPDSSLSYQRYFVESLPVYLECMVMLLDCLFRVWLVLPFRVKTGFSLTACLFLKALAQPNPMTCEPCSNSMVSCTLFLFFVTYCDVILPFPQTLTHQFHMLPVSWFWHLSSRKGLVIGSTELHHTLCQIHEVSVFRISVWHCCYFYHMQYRIWNLNKVLQ
jgi:hypothetical protein